ncbi:MAG: hypothetical protein ACLGI2_13915 [Acidimicrobiia bacterium]
MRRAAWWLGLVAAVALLPACSSAHELPAAPWAEAAPAPAAPPPPTVADVREAIETEEAARFSFGEPDIRAVRVAAELPEDVRREIHDLLDRYLNEATVTPLRKGRAVEDLSEVFSGRALERASGPDRAALVDDGLPRVARLHVGDASAQLTALVGPGGVAVMAAAIHVLVSGAVPGGGLTVERTAELQLARDGDSWRVGGYDVSVTRTGPDGIVTTTTTTEP